MSDVLVRWKVKTALQLPGQTKIVWRHPGDEDIWPRGFAESLEGPGMVEIIEEKEIPVVNRIGSLDED